MTSASSSKRAESQRQKLKAGSARKQDFPKEKDISTWSHYDPIELEGEDVARFVEKLRTVKVDKNLSQFYNEKDNNLTFSL